MCKKNGASVPSKDNHLGEDNYLGEEEQQEKLQKAFSEGGSLCCGQYVDVLSKSSDNHLVVVAQKDLF